MIPVLFFTVFFSRSHTSKPKKEKQKMAASASGKTLEELAGTPAEQALAIVKEWILANPDPDPPCGGFEFFKYRENIGSHSCEKWKKWRAIEPEEGKPRGAFYMRMAFGNELYFTMGPGNPTWCAKVVMRFGVYTTEPNRNMPALVPAAMWETYRTNRAIHMAMLKRVFNLIPGFDGQCLKQRPQVMNDSGAFKLVSVRDDKTFFMFEQAGQGPIVLKYHLGYHALKTDLRVDEFWMHPLALDVYMAAIQIAEAFVENWKRVSALRLMQVSRRIRGTIVFPDRTVACRDLQVDFESYADASVFADVAKSTAFFVNRSIDRSKERTLLVQVGEKRFFHGQHLKWNAPGYETGSYRVVQKGILTNGLGCLRVQRFDKDLPEDQQDPEILCLPSNYFVPDHNST